MTYFKKWPISKIGLFKKLAYFKNGLFQKLEYFKFFTGAIIIGNVTFFLEKNATTFGNALYTTKGQQL